MLLLSLSLCWFSSHVDTLWPHLLGALHSWSQGSFVGGCDAVGPLSVTGGEETPRRHQSSDHQRWWTNSFLPKPDRVLRGVLHGEFCARFRVVFRFARALQMNVLVRDRRCMSAVLLSPGKTTFSETESWAPAIRDEPIASGLGMLKAEIWVELPPACQTTTFGWWLLLLAHASLLITWFCSNCCIFMYFCWLFHYLFGISVLHWLQSRKNLHTSGGGAHWPSPISLRSSCLCKTWPPSGTPGERHQGAEGWPQYGSLWSVHIG